MIGLCAALHCAQRGFRVTVIERNGERRDGCSYGNTGMVVPSHFVPLAAPGMVALALRWMWNPASPFYIKPRLSLDLAKWGLQFTRAANAAHVQRAAPLLCRLHMESRALYEKLAASANDFHFDTEIIIQLLNAEQRIVELPIPTYYGDEICRVNGLGYAWNVMAATIRNAFHRSGLLHQRRYEPVSDGNTHYDLKLGYPSSHTFAIDSVPSGATVLDLGGGPGGVARERDP